MSRSLTLTHDILIRGGTCLRRQRQSGRAGRSRDPRRPHRAIAPSVAGERRKTIDAHGLAVAPGFIDIKTHSDFTLPINPKAESKVRQGVTTEIIGHCGFSVAPALPGKVELLKDYLSPSRAVAAVPRADASRDYLDTFPATVGERRHAGRPQHAAADGDGHGRTARRPPPSSTRMIALLEDGLKAGALGMSSGLFTPPGSYAQPDEMVAFGHVLKRHNAGYFTHLRDESNKVLEAVQEAIDVAEPAASMCRRSRAATA